jgi:hypothetical protein
VAEFVRRRFVGMERRLLDPPPPHLRAGRGLTYELRLPAEAAEHVRNREPLIFVSLDPDRDVLERGEIVIPKVLDFFVRRT